MADLNGTNGRTSTPDAPPSWSSLLRLYSALQSRAGLAQRLGTMFDGRRPMHSLLGYVPEGALTYRDFKARYRRQHLAHRLVRVYPDATWAQPPSVEEDNTSETETPFEAAWSELVTRLKLFAHLQQTDVLANLGQYAVLLIGLRGQSDLQNPARPVRGPDDVLYLKPYSEEWASIERLEGNAGLPTFGEPLLYRINFGRNTTQGKAVLPIGQGLVHASRVIHFADDCLDDEVYGTPALEPIFDLLDDLMKVVGGAGEMFWRDAKRKIALEVREGYTISPADEKAMTQEVEEWIYDLKDFLRLDGVQAKNMAGVVQSPKEHVEVILDLISAARGVPKRILFGSERGELASTQDKDEWLGKITLRQKQTAEPRLLRPLVDRFIALHAVPQPAQPYQVFWQNLLSLSEDQQATIAEKVARAANEFASGNAELLIPFPEYRSVYLGLAEVSEFAIPEIDLNPEPPLPGPEPQPPPEEPAP